MEQRSSLRAWALCVAVLIGPSVLVWAVRLTALFTGCAPGPGLCHGMTLGAGLRDTLGLAFLVASNAWLVVGLSLAATLIAFRACRPLLGTLSLASLPILAPMLPILAVLASRYHGCSADTIGSCQMWGAAMGFTFRDAAAAREVLYSIYPYTFALTVMLGIIGFCFARPKPPVQAMADGRHRFDETDAG